jgi:vacuolar-type H+-ATPase subunit H
MEQARREAELVMTEAHAEARAVTREALAERERLHNEARRIRTQLTHALETMDAETADPAVDDVEAEAA